MPLHRRRMSDAVQRRVAAVLPLIALVLAAAFAAATPPAARASAGKYCQTCHPSHEPPSQGHDMMGKPCASCHHKWGQAGYDPHSDQNLYPTMPHGAYDNGTEKCTMCHVLHEAASSSQLLPAVTVTGVCMTCHNQTGARGVYGRIVASGGTVAAEHRVDLTTTVPGGSTPLSEDLYCDSCHTPHDNTTIQDFNSDDIVSASDPPASGATPPFPTSRHKLLRDDLRGTPRGTYSAYGSAWCAACHDRRVPSEAMHNHPVDTTTAHYLGAWTGDFTDYGFFANRWYTFDPVPASPDGRVSPRPAAPICQQCHGNARDVETTATFKASWWNGVVPEPNPRFYSFPHQATNPRFTVETADDLCLNCHPTGALP